MVLHTIIKHTFMKCVVWAM